MALDGQGEHLDGGAEVLDAQGRPILKVVAKHQAVASNDTYRGTRPADPDGRPHVVLVDALGNDLTSVGGALKPFTNSTRTSTIAAPSLRDIVSLADFPGFDRTGSTDQSPVLRAAIAEVQATAQGGYGPNAGGMVYVPQGRYLLASKVPIPEKTAIWGAGFGATTFLVREAGAGGFRDNCVFEPTLIDSTQEFVGLGNFTLYGQTSGNLPINHQANAGVATTVLNTISGISPNITYNSFTLSAVGDLSAYAPSGTLTVGTKRVIYQSVDTVNRLFKSCYIISNDIGKAINAGDAIAPVTQWNISGVQLFGIAFPSYLRDVWIEYFSQSCVISGYITATEHTNINAAYAGRHAYQHIVSRSNSIWRGINGLYPGNDGSGNPYAGMYLLGVQAVNPFSNGVSIDTFYGGMTQPNTIGLWLQNAGGVSASNIDIEEGTPDASHVGVQIDSDKSNPLAQDGAHATNIDLRNIQVNGIGRVPIKDNVRSRSMPANTTTLGMAISRYTTEDNSPGTAYPFVGSSPYWADSLAQQGGDVWKRNATGIARTSFDATERALWTPTGKANRDKALRRGTLVALTETVPHDFITIAFLSGLTSGTQYGAVIPVFAGETYGHTTLTVGTTGATWGSNNDGHWYVAVYDDSGNLVVQTADQGFTGLTASTSTAVALASTFTPTVDALYRIVIMVYLGTGGVPVMPTFRAVNSFTGLTIVGLPQETFSANAGQTTGVAPGTIGTLGGALGAKPWIALYT